MVAEPLLYHGLIIGVPIPSKHNWVFHYLQQAVRWFVHESARLEFDTCSKETNSISGGPTTS